MGINSQRVVIFTATYFVLDGVTLTIRRLEEHLEQVGIAYRICTTRPHHLNPDMIHPKFIFVPRLPLPLPEIPTMEYALGYGLDTSSTTALDMFRPTCCHFTVPDFVAIDGIVWCQQRNIPYLSTWHSNYTDYIVYYSSPCLNWIFVWLIRIYLHEFYRKIPILYVPTERMRNRLHNEGYLSKIRVWGRGVDTSLYHPNRRSERLRMRKGVAPNDIVILWVGRWVPEKRVDIWMYVVEKLLTLTHRTCHGWIVGNGIHKIHKNIHCWGWLSGQSLAEVYASSDILLFPSDVETFGNVTLEAMASGCCPVVEEECGGHLVENGINGLCCTAGDATCFYQQTQNLVLLDTETRLKMSAQARAKAIQYESVEIQQQMVDFYCEATVSEPSPSEPCLGINCWLKHALVCVSNEANIRWWTIIIIHYFTSSISIGILCLLVYLVVRTST